MSNHGTVLHDGETPQTRYTHAHELFFSRRASNRARPTPLLAVAVLTLALNLSKLPGEAGGAGLGREVGRAAECGAGRGERDCVISRKPVRRASIQRDCLLSAGPMD